MKRILTLLLALTSLASAETHGSIQEGSRKADIRDSLCFVMPKTKSGKLYLYDQKLSDDQRNATEAPAGQVGWVDFFYQGDQLVGDLYLYGSQSTTRLSPQEVSNFTLSSNRCTLNLKYSGGGCEFAFESDSPVHQPLVATAPPGELVEAYKAYHDMARRTKKWEAFKPWISGQRYKALQQSERARTAFRSDLEAEAKIELNTLTRFESKPLDDNAVTFSVTNGGTNYSSVWWCEKSTGRWRLR
ncbi:hypothetical protein ABS71_12510 [bacterium SCN 62-11]|nr:MAG: hypothetical protein ABS71_12510 [bacterium SCN 62-11]